MLKFCVDFLQIPTNVRFYSDKVQFWLMFLHVKPSISEYGEICSCCAVLCAVFAFAAQHLFAEVLNAVYMSIILFGFAAFGGSPDRIPAAVLWFAS